MSPPNNTCFLHDKVDGHVYRRTLLLTIVINTSSFFDKWAKKLEKRRKIVVHFVFHPTQVQILIFVSSPHLLLQAIQIVCCAQYTKRIHRPCILLYGKLHIFVCVSSRHPYYYDTDTFLPRCELPALLRSSFEQLNVHINRPLICKRHHLVLLFFFFSLLLLSLDRRLCLWKRRHRGHRPQRRPRRG